MTRESRRKQFKEALQERVLIFDGAMGTMIQERNLQESDFRSKDVESVSIDLKGNNDLLNLTSPSVISSIHRSFLEAGAEILTTNTFNANSISQSDYGLEKWAPEMSRQGAMLACEVAQKATEELQAKEGDLSSFLPKGQQDHREMIWVAGSLGPTNRTASLSPDVENPAYRNVTFDILSQSYFEAAEALWDGGVDFLLIETIFDTLNAKAAIFAVKTLEEKRGEEIPLLISGTITDLSGRNLSGQTAEAMYYSMRHANPLAFGLNCSLGAKELRPYVMELAELIDCPLLVYPNAGLPNEMGAYDETPEETARLVQDWIQGRKVNIIGGCCGSTPEHIRHIATLAQGCAPRKPQPPLEEMRLSGLEGFKRIS